MAWVPITNAEIDPESPATTGLMTKYRDNDEALYDSMVMVVKAVNESDNSAGVLQNDDELVVTMLANQTWRFDMVLLVSSTIPLAGVDLDFDFTFPAGATYMLTHDIHESGATLSSGYTTEASGVSQVNYNTVNVNLIFFHGWVKTAGAGGDFQLQWASTHNGTTIWVYAGSYLAAKQDHATM